MTHLSGLPRFHRRILVFTKQQIPIPDPRHAHYALALFVVTSGITLCFGHVMSADAES